MKRIIYPAGFTREQLTIVSYVGKIEGCRGLVWRVRCNCGSEFNITGGNFRRVTSCKKCGNARTAFAKTTHGATRGSGAIRSPLYKLWQSMLNRCKPYNSKAKWYFEKEIRVCDEWVKDFAAFRLWSKQNGYRDGLSIDRIDTAKGYSPDNCRWVTRTWNIKRIVETPSPFADHFPIEALWGAA